MPYSVKFFTELISFVATVRADGGAPRLFLSLVTFVSEQALLGTARAFSFLSADLGDALLFCGGAALDRRFDFIQQESARQEAVKTL